MAEAENRSGGSMIAIVAVACLATIVAVLVLRQPQESKQGNASGKTSAASSSKGAGAGVWVFTDANFESDVLKSSVPVMVDFGAVWCGPCKAQSPIISELGNEFAGRAKIGKIDVDANRKTAGRYNVRALPTILLFKNGKDVQSFVGLTSKEILEDSIKRVLKW